MFDKPDPMDGPFFEETIYVTPSRQPASVLADLESTVARACTALGLREGPVHAELRLDTGGALMILELAARSIGGFFTRALRFGAGVSLQEVIIRHALGLGLDGLTRETQASGVMMLPIRSAGVLERVSGQERALAIEGVVGVEFSIASGRPVVPLPEGDRYLGFVLPRGPTPRTSRTPSPAPGGGVSGGASALTPGPVELCYPLGRLGFVRVLLVSTYELGHQPLHVAMPATALLAAGHDVRCVDVAVDPLDGAAVDWADRVAYSAVPMHTAMRLALHIAETIQAPTTRASAVLLRAVRTGEPGSHRPVGRRRRHRWRVRIGAGGVGGRSGPRPHDPAGPCRSAGSSPPPVAAPRSIRPAGGRRRGAPGRVR